MKNLRDFLMVVAVGATLTFPGRADAELFQRFKARRAARRAAAEVCVGPQCTMPVGTGRLGINRKGGFIGQLPDSYYADYFAQKTSVPTPAEKVPEVPEKVEVSILVEPASSVADAQASVAAAETALAEAKAGVERAVVKQQQADDREALRLQQQINGLTARLKALEPE